MSAYRDGYKNGQTDARMRRVLDISYFAFDSSDYARQYSKGYRDAISDVHRTNHAKRGLALVRAVVARNEAWRANGHTCHLGVYRIDSIDANGTVHAGCHVVPYAEIERIAPTLDNYESGTPIPQA